LSFITKATVETREQELIDHPIVSFYTDEVSREIAACKCDDCDPCDYEAS